MDELSEKVSSNEMHSKPVVSAVSATEPDWTRENRCGGQWRSATRLLRSIRRYQYWQGRWGFLGRLIAKLYVLPYQFWSVVSGAEISINTRLGGGLMLPHPNGIVIHPSCKMGPNCMLFQQVTLGAGGQIPGVPQLGGHVDVGAGAKILGGVLIGDHAKIGANAVVLTDVPAHCSAVGIPARILHPKV